MRRATEQIAVIGLSNVGDGILMSPVIAQLHGRYPKARIALFVGARAGALFAGDPRVDRVINLDDFEGWWGRLRLGWAVRTLNPDVLIDLRQTILPLIWRPWTFLRYIWPISPTTTHMGRRHLSKLRRQLGRRAREGTFPNGQPPIWISPDDRAHVDGLVRRWKLQPGKDLVILCPGARTHIKRWYADRFAQLADRLIEGHQVEVVVTGEPDEQSVVRELLEAMRQSAHSAVACTTMRQLAALMQRAKLVVTNDSASLHLACAVGAPVVALFGPTDPIKYGPTGPHDRIIQRRLFCVPCERSLCRFAHECMRFITTDEVYEAARAVLSARPRHHVQSTARSR